MYFCAGQKGNFRGTKRELHGTKKELSRDKKGTLKKKYWEKGQKRNFTGQKRNFDLKLSQNQVKFQVIYNELQAISFEDIENNKI